MNCCNPSELVPSFANVEKSTSCIISVDLEYTNKSRCVLYADWRREHMANVRKVESDALMGLICPAY